MQNNRSRTSTPALLAVLVAISALLPTSQRALAADGIKITPDVVYGHKHGLALTFDVFTPEKDANGAGVLFMVSGGWFSRWQTPESMLGFTKPLIQKGFTVFAVRHGSSPKFVIPEIAEDVRRSVRFIRMNAERFGVDPERLGVCGLSAGGHLSLLLGTTADEGDSTDKDPVLRKSNRVAAVVAICPPTDIRPFVDPKSWYYEKFPALQFDPKKAAAFSPVANVSKDDAPSLMIHGDQDKLVKIDHSQKIHKAFEEKGVDSKLLTIEGAGHGIRGKDMQRANTEMVAWFEKYLKKSSKD